MSDSTPDSTSTGRYHDNINFPEAQSNEHALLDLHPTNDEPGPDSGAFSGNHRIAIVVLGFEQPLSQSRLTLPVQENIAEALGVPNPDDRVNRDRLAGLLTAIFKACKKNISAWVKASINQAWHNNEDLPLFYNRVLDEVKTQGIEGGGFHLKADDVSNASPNPGNLDELNLATVVQLTKVYTFSRLKLTSDFPQGYLGPVTPLTELVDEWIFLTTSIRWVLNTQYENW
ncbi:hypothetical protein F4781DRAFT_430468 [Annulohypoxylon bovei var. microspora]|nr:hypothetical protein F4781DRAFT_430468 [Annulohypoxylon bovei var. microspora]